MNRNFYYIDIETAPAFAHYADAPERLRALWDKKHKTYAERDGLEPGADPSRQDWKDYTWQKYAALHAEFGRVVCLTLGDVTDALADEKLLFVKLVSYCGDDERANLKPFLRLMASKKYKPLCGHNIKGFDLPFICRRAYALGLAPLPSPIQVAGKKPWEIEHEDTLELWKFGCFKDAASLDLVAATLGIESPKTEMSGADVRAKFYEEFDYDAIARYCEVDVRVTALVHQRLLGYDYASASKEPKAMPDESAAAIAER